MMRSECRRAELLRASLERLAREIAIRRMPTWLKQHSRSNEQEHNSHPLPPISPRGYPSKTLRPRGEII
eukprot:5193769-Heterocapsa_arctica.AAC.1